MRWFVKYQSCKKRKRVWRELASLERQMATIMGEMGPDKPSPQRKRMMTILPDEWERHIDSESGDTYYARPDGTTQWDRPPGNEHLEEWIINEMVPKSEPGTRAKDTESE